MEFTLALAQINTRLGDVEANLEKHLSLAKQARADGADLLVFPELSLTGYVLQDLASTVAHTPDGDDPIFKHLLAASRDLALVVGFVDEDRRHRFFIARLGTNDFSGHCACRNISQTKLESELFSHGGDLDSHHRFG